MACRGVRSALGSFRHPWKSRRRVGRLLLLLATIAPVCRGVRLALGSLAPLEVLPERLVVAPVVCIFVVVLQGMALPPWHPWKSRYGDVVVELFPIERRVACCHLLPIGTGVSPWSIGFCCRSPCSAWYSGYVVGTRPRISKEEFIRTVEEW